MAHNLGLEVIAEGVETEEQAAFLRKEKCEEAQGFLYSCALTGAAFQEYLAGFGAGLHPKVAESRRGHSRKRRVSSVSSIRSRASSS
jgi:predicted signal transduction protein with EAL and GGDEF domain